MRRIFVGNPQTDSAHKTYLSEQYASGVSASVLSNVSFSVNDLAIFGEVGEEQTELKKINLLTGKETLGFPSALNFSHSKDTPVYKVPWDFIHVEGRSTSAGTFAILSESPIQWDKLETVYYHESGTSTWEYRFRFYNSSNQTYSEYSPTISGGGFNRDQVGFMVGNVRKLTNDLKGRVVSDDEIINFFNDAGLIIYARNPKYWFLKVDTYKGSNGIAATSGNDVYSLASYTNFSHLHLIRYRYNSGGTDRIYALAEKPELEFDALTRDNNRTAEDWPEFFKLLPPDDSSENGYFQVEQDISNSGVGTFYPVYFKEIPELETFDDETVVPIPQLLEHFAIAQIEKIKGNEAKAKTYEDLFYGPNERRKGFERLQGLALLDEINRFKERGKATPRQLIRFLGQKGATRLTGERDIAVNRDYLKENYF